MFSKSFFASVVVVMYAANAVATPFPEPSKHPTHRKRQLGAGLELETYYPPSVYETFGLGKDHPLRKRATEDLKDAAMSYVTHTLDINEDNIHWTSGFYGETSSHAFVSQELNGIPVANAVANVAFSIDDKVVAFGSSFVPEPTRVAPANATLSLEDAIAIAEKLLRGSHNGHPTKLEYLAQEDGSLALTHVVQIVDDEGGWFEAFINAHSGQLLSVTDFVSHAMYNAIPITKQSPTQGFERLVNPEDKVASPRGWHDDGTTIFTETIGNNAVSFKVINQTLVTTKQSAKGLVFDYAANLTQQPTTATNIDAARVNAFYVVNTMHDITYRYGFTETAFNFQADNNEKGGCEGDPVLVSVQDAAGINNADFASPPDGQSGFMRLFLWNFTDPLRDSGISNDIIVHEMTHGVTERLTGGGTSRCLQTVESHGLAEGWSDAMAEWTTHDSSTVKDYALSRYLIDRPSGIRTHPYSTSTKTNPLRYSSITKLNSIHSIGEVWANMLHQVVAALLIQKGFSDDAFENPEGTGGNVVFLHLFMDALVLQPCNPTFVSARDAWIQADLNRFRGAHTCVLWRAFASRGLGTKARNFHDDTTIPSNC